MNVDYLLAFRCVMRHKSFRRAAEDLHISQPAVSKQIRALEDEVGERLFERGRSVRSTLAGEVLIKYADRVCQSMDAARDEIGDLKSQGHGRLAIAAYHVLAVHFLPPLIERYRSLCPKVKVTVQTDWPEGIIHRVEAHDADVGILVRPNNLDALPNLSYLPLNSAEMIFVTAPHAGLVNEAEVPLDELRKVPFVLCPDGCPTRRYLELRLAERGYTAQIAVESSNLDLQSRLVELGLGVGILPKGIIVPQLKQKKLRQFYVRDFQFRVESGLVHRRDKYIHTAMKAFLEVARAAPASNLQQGARPV